MNREHITFAAMAGAFVLRKVNVSTGNLVYLAGACLCLYLAYRFGVVRGTKQTILAMSIGAVVGSVVGNLLVHGAI